MPLSHECGGALHSVPCHGRVKHSAHWPRSALALAFALSLVLADLSSAFAQGGSAPIVLAQNDNRPPIFRFLFNRPRGERVIDVPPRAAPQRQVRPQQQRSSKPKRQRSSSRSSGSSPRRAAPAAAPAPVVEKGTDAKKVLVVGDFMARSVARGLDAAYSENPNVVVAEATNGSSGLVRDDFYDWPAELPGILEEEKPDAVVMMIGANDRQALATSAGSRSPGSPEWRAAYADRVGEVASLLAGAEVPAYWVGLVPVRSGTMSKDYSSFNSIYRERIEPLNVRYVDIWDAFADEEGRFAASGPDVSGQTTQLRDSDGLNFTRAGQAKLGFFVKQALDEVMPAAPGETVAAATPEMVLPAPEDGPAIGPMIPISAITTPAAAELSSSAETRVGQEAGDASELIVGRLALNEDVEVPPTRIDNYSWPRRSPTSSAVSPSAAAAAAAGRGDLNEAGPTSP